MTYCPQQGDEPPPQEVFVINLLRITHWGAVVATLQGQEAEIPLTFIGNSRILDGLTSPQEPHNGLLMTVKDFGRIARQTLGLDPVTPLQVTTRVVYENQVLPMHRPMSTLLEADTALLRQAAQCCHFCRKPLHLHSRAGASASLDSGPRQHCLYCLDEPAWHHGDCCPCNPVSVYCDGKPHFERYRSSWFRYHNLRDIPGMNQHFMAPRW